MVTESLAKRMSRLGTETAFEVLAAAKQLEAQGKNVIHLEIGEPDFATPGHIIDAAYQAMRQGYTHYTPASGLPELREAIASYATRQKGVAVDPAEVVVTPGGKPIIFFTILALVNEGEEVIYPNPGFPIYESVIDFVGGIPVPVPLREEREFALDAEELCGLITPRTKLIILNSPHNPTGGIIGEEDLRLIADHVRGRKIFVLSDEIYDRIVYDGAPRSLASLPEMKEHTIILDGFSKTYAMTGWRIGFGIMPAPLAAQVTKLMVNSNSCTAAFTQRAAISALTGPQEPSARMVEEFRRRRDRIVAGLNAIPGVRCCLPKGSFYVFPNVSEVGDCRELARYLLYEAGVATLAGTAFGKYGEGYLRLSYANSLENIDRALERMDAALRRYRR